MKNISYKKRDIAIKQLETAIRLYEEQLDPFSVITLAGAAEEILGKCVRASGKVNSLDTLEKVASEIQRIEGEQRPVKVAWRANYARNHSKHWDEAEGDSVSIDAWQEARDMLTRATDNYWLLDECDSPPIESFFQQVRN